MEKSDEVKSQASFVSIDENRAGQRIDNFLFSYLKNVPKSRIYRMLRKGEVRVNRGRINAQYKLSVGDNVRIPPVFQQDEKQELNRHVLSQFKQIIADKTLYEDELIWVVNKPAGVPVHGGTGLSYGLIEGVRACRPELSYLELVHRLDRETSGCLILAKKRKALVGLHAQFRDDEVKKSYLALLEGVWGRRRLSVDAPLRKNVMKGGERMVHVDSQGKTAITEFRRVEKLLDVTLVEARPQTGRTHQIRVHALHMGHPLVGDSKYGNSEFNTELRALGLHRLFLHAQSLVFRHPGSGEMQEVKAPMPAELVDVLSKIRKKNA